ncbi:YihY/virulence factor BrkB family protein [Microterricola viridarii]|uniref:YihY/virulence factor BrkB family protein n=1 Tax=Microterricola viridarii TaxID=412690 RepID=UPI001F48C276|nr:YihY/virulence factor BrkB family protein [Microterricola viridarii]
MSQTPDRGTEKRVREAFDAFGEPIRERFGEPVQRVNALTQKTLALFPVRVWRHFLARNGFLLAAGMSYQALFAAFAAVYVVFSVAGLWLVSHPSTLHALENLINTYIPGLIGQEGQAGAISSSELTGLASDSTFLLSSTGVIAAAGLIWTAIGWVTYSRISVRTVFGLAKDTRSYVLLKARDFVAALAFGATLLLASTLTVVSTAALSWLFKVFGLPVDSFWYNLAGSSVGLLLVLIINAGVLAAMFRFLSGAAVEWRRLWGGSLLGSVALTVMQVLGSTLIGGVTKNPLLATFAVFVGLLLWFRLTSIVTLVAAAWIAVAAGDRGESLRKVTSEQLEMERRERELQALRLAAEVELRQARAEHESAPWYRRPATALRLRQATQRHDALTAQQADSASADAAHPSGHNGSGNGNGHGNGHGSGNGNGHDSGPAPREH